MNAAQLAIDMARGQEQRIDARNEDKAATVQAGCIFWLIMNTHSGRW